MGAENWAGIGSTVASLFFLYNMVKDHIPFQVSDYVAAVFHKVLSFFKPYVDITIQEYHGDGEYFKRDELYIAAQAYLSCTCSSRASKLKAELGEDSDTPHVTIDNNEGVADSFRGIQVWWYACEEYSNSQTFSWYPRQNKRKYVMRMM